MPCRTIINDTKVCPKKIAFVPSVHTSVSFVVN